MNPVTAPATVRVLFVDDLPRNFRLIEQRLKRAFQDLGCEPDLQYESDADTAYNRITGEEPFDVVLVDLLWKDPDQPDMPVERQEPRGLRLIDGVRRSSAKTVVVALTIGTPLRPELEQHARDRDADIVLQRGNLTDDSAYGGIDRLVREVYDLLCERELIVVGPDLSLPDEPGVQAAVHDMTQATCRLLIADLVDAQGTAAVRADLSYVTPGASGAHVLRARIELSDGSSRQLLIKTSRDRASLMREASNSRRLLGLYDGSLIVRYLPIDAGSRMRNGWSAIATDFAEDAVTIREWLGRPASTQHVASVLSQLFLKRGLAATYGEPIGDHRGEQPLDRLRMPPFRRVLVRSAVKQLAPVLRHPDGGGFADIADTVLSTIEAFLRSGRIGARTKDETPKGLVLVNAHGDLHGANVLVCGSHQPRPLIIDLASFDVWHWAFDPARLTADMLLRTFDGPVESYLWRRLRVWREVSVAASKLDGVPDGDESNAAVIAALNWMGENRGHVLPWLASPDAWWEWHVALAEQLLRGTYQADLPPAKRVVALVAAYDQLLLAEQRMPALEATF